MFINTIIFSCFDLFPPYDVMKQLFLEVFDFRAVEINNWAYSDAIVRLLGKK